MNSAKIGNNLEKNRRKNILIVSVIILLVIIVGVCLYFFLIKDNEPAKEKNVETDVIKSSDYRINSNRLEPFDLYFLQLENGKENKVYSPLSIKYALEMLSDGANGNTKKQIDNILGDYEVRKYTDSANMSFANGLFIKNTYKNYVRDDYVNLVANRYNAQVFVDSFEDARVLNNWISNKTFNLIPSIADDISRLDFILTNALAIDMEWVKMIQSVNDYYMVTFPHLRNKEDSWAYNLSVAPLGDENYHGLDFFNINCKVKSSEIAAVANRYDIVNILGEDYIRNTVTEAYEEYIITNPEYIIDDFDTWLDNYMIEIDSNYKHVSSSTDFYFYVDDDTKVFAKDLKEYDGTTLQYVGIMPTTEDLDSYIDDIDASKVNDLIDNLHSIELNSFKDGVITEITGYIPMFNFDYELDLLNDLKTLGMTDVFDFSKADLSNMVDGKAVINEVIHKTNIEFSNEGIKAASATMVGGYGNATDGFDYFFEIPIEKIDLTFDKPYMFLIRDKDTGEVWFTGTVYNPVKYIPAY